MKQSHFKERKDYNYSIIRMVKQYYNMIVLINDGPASSLARIRIKKLLHECESKLHRKGYLLD